MKDKQITFEIQEHIAILSESESGWTKELNLVSWNNNKAKYDIREWSSNHEKMTKGITLYDDEMNELVKAYIKFKKKDDVQSSNKSE